MVRGYTTIEQSKKLLSLGLDPNTADMCYPHFVRYGADTYNEIPEIAEDIDYPYEMPCWSLAALLELMPAKINSNEEYYRLTSHKSLFNGEFFKPYLLFYKNFANKRIYEVNRDNFVDAAFEMVCWLIEQGHIKVNK